MIKRNLLIKITALVFMMLILITPAFTADFETYENKEGGYSISYPSKWELRKLDSKKNRTQIGIISPSEGSKDIFIENVVIMSFNNISRKITVEEYFNANLIKLKEKYKIISKGTSKINGVEAKWVKCLKSDGQKLKIMQYYLVKDDNLYLITCGSTVSNYKNYKSTFDKIIQSFNLNSKAGKKPGI